jgi:hypothetical protein
MALFFGTTMFAGINLCFYYEAIGETGVPQVY